MAATTQAAKPLTKSQLMANIAETTNLSKRDISTVFDALSGEIASALGRKGPGVFTLPGLLKIEKKKVPAKPARKNVPNPFKPGETMDIPAKKATTKIKVRPLKNLKEM